MSQKGIIINTTNNGHVVADDHAILFKAIFGNGGILNIGNKLTISKLSDNRIRMQDGVYMLSNGVPIRVEGTEEFVITSGTLGQKRKDAIIAEYVRNGNGSGNDIARIRVLTGSYSTSNPKLPKLTNNSQTVQELIATLYINETTMEVETVNAFVLKGLSDAVYLR